MPKRIIGRIVEKQRLEEALHSNRSELIAVYGRRRIGKTHLIREFYTKHFIFSSWAQEWHSTGSDRISHE